MKYAYAIIIFILTLLIFSGCEFSPNPKDHGLPTMEELLQSPYVETLPYWQETDPEAQKKIKEGLLQEKEFFYKYANKIYLSYPPKELLGAHIILSNNLYKELEKKHPKLLERLNRQHTGYYGADTFELFQDYFDLLITYQKNR